MRPTAYLYKIDRQANKFTSLILPIVFVPGTGIVKSFFGKLYLPTTVPEK